MLADHLWLSMGNCATWYVCLSKEKLSGHILKENRVNKKPSTANTNGSWCAEDNPPPLINVAAVLEHRRVVMARVIDDHRTQCMLQVCCGYLDAVYHLVHVGIAIPAVVHREHVEER